MTAPTTYCNHLATHEALDRFVGCGSELTGYDLIVLIVIARHTSHDARTCWLAYETIAREALVSRRSAVTIVHRLVTLKLISVDGRHQGRTNLYRLTLDQCKCCTSANAAPVQMLHSTSATAAPEVVPELDPEVVKGSSARTRSANGGLDGQARRLNSVGLETEKRKAEKAATPIPPANPHAPPSPGPACPDRELSDLYWDRLGQPARLSGKLAVEWPDIFQGLLRDWSYTDLQGAILWAFESDFWSDKLPRRVGDPVEYFAEKAETIIDQYLRDGEDAARAAKKAVPAQPSTPEQRSSQPGISGIRFNHI